MAEGSHAKKNARCSTCFNPLWEEAYLFAERGGAAICLVCHKTVNQLKKYNIQRHYTAYHSKMYAHLSPQEKLDEVDRLKARLFVVGEELQNEDEKPVNEAASRSNYIDALELAKTCRPFSLGPFFKELLVKVVQEEISSLSDTETEGDCPEKNWGVKTVTVVQEDNENTSPRNTTASSSRVRENFIAPPLPKRTRKNEEHSIVDMAFQILKDSHERCTTSTKSDRFSTYGEHIANKLRTYPGKVVSIVEHKINNILFEADMGCYDRDISIPSGSSHSAQNSIPSTTPSPNSPPSRSKSP